MKTIAIIGAGPAGIEAAALLAKQGAQVDLFEKEASPMQHLADKAFLFPNFANAADLMATLEAKLQTPGINQHMGTEICAMKPDPHSGWELTDSQGSTYHADKVLMATGYTPFDAHRKEELGYGIYDGVITSLDMERMIRNEQVVNSRQEKPRRIVFLQCVGSRDEKSGNHYCSKVCCVTAVKQAIEIKKRQPETEVYIFYMDLRMWGQHFEELYRSAQQDYGVRFVRGRISEASGTFDGRVQIKAEDTLMGLPLKMTTDLLVLMVGMEASEGTRRLATACDICGEYGFAQSKDPHLGDTLTAREGLYLCGTCKRPMSINDAVNDARAAAWAMIEA